MKRKKLKYLSAVCTAVMALSMTAGMSAGSIPAPSVFRGSAIVASASESAEISAKAFGLVTPANSVKVKKGNVTILDLEWNDFAKGSNLTVQDGTVLELIYDDGTLVLDAVTREVVSNTRKSGISREKFYISNESINVNPKDKLSVWISKRDEDGNCFTKAGEYFSAESYGTTDEKVNKGDNTFELEFDYAENAEVIIVHNPFNVKGTRIGSYNARMNKANNDTFQFNNMPIFMKINNEWFPAENGYNSVEITKADGGTFHASTEENKGTYVYDGNMIKKVIFTAEEFSKGTGVIGITFPANPNESLHVKFNYDNGSAVYCCLGISTDSDTPMFCQMYKSDRTYSNVTDGNNNPITDTSNKPVTDGNINGKPVVSDETVKYDNELGDYSVEIYEGAFLINTLSSADFEQGEYFIDNYKEDRNYYVRLVKENGDSVYYKYNKRLGAWVFRIDTAETPLYTINLNTSMFPNETRAEEATVTFGNKEILSITGEQFAVGTEKFDIATSKCSDYRIEFTDTNPADKDLESKTYNYVLIGIDAEGAEVFDKIKDYIYIPAPNPSDKLVIDGTTADGDKIHAEVGKETSDGFEVTLPDGTYDIYPDTADGNGEGRYTDTVVIENGTTDKTDWDFSPVTENVAVVKTPDGIVIGEYTGAGDFTSLGQVVSEDEIPDCPYYIVDKAEVAVNAVVPEDRDYTTEYATADKKGNLSFFTVLKGDVNLDGKINVSDLVLAQKYLLNNLDSKEDFGLKNFIAFDVCEDGDGDVFDMVELRKIVIEAQTKK